MRQGWIVFWISFARLKGLQQEIVCKLHQSKTFHEKTLFLLRMNSFRILQNIANAECVYRLIKAVEVTLSDIKHCFLEIIPSFHVNYAHSFVRLHLTLTYIWCFWLSTNPFPYSSSCCFCLYDINLLLYYNFALLLIYVYGFELHKTTLI